MTNLFKTVILFGLMTITIQRNIEYDQDTSKEENAEIQQLLKVFDSNDKYVPKGKKRYSHTHMHHNSNRHGHHEDDHANLMNIQTLNLILNDADLRKKIKAQRTNEDAEKVFQLEYDRACKATGRCGCGGSRCGRSGKSQDPEDELQLFVNYLENETGAENRNRNVVGDEKDNFKKSGKLRCKGNRCESSRSDNEDIYDLKENLERQGNKYKVNDDVDAVVLEMADLDDLLSNSFDNKYSNKKRKYDNVNRNSKVYNEKAMDSKRNNIDVVILDLSKFDGDDSKKRTNAFLSKNSDEDSHVRPDDLIKYYERQKGQVTNQILKYIKDRYARKENIEYLPEKQKRQVKNIKYQIQKRGAEFNDKELEKEINRIVFEQDLDTKVLPHEENNNNVYIPKWLHSAVSDSMRRNLRAQKRLLPLTQQQVTKLQQKKTNRRNFQDNNLENYAVPFELEVQGLGQVNP